jgi:hypothetical protein
MDRWAYKSIVRYFLKLRRDKEKIDIDSEYIFSSLDRSITLSIVLAFFVGALATMPIVLYELYYLKKIEDMFTQTSLEIVLSYVSIIAIFIFIEFYLLYKIGFYITAKMIYMIYRAKESGTVATNIKDREFLSSLVRVILEKPEKKRVKFNLDPYKYKQKSHIFITLLYKLKVTLTNYIAKLILKRVLTRSAIRGFEALVAIPITGVLNAYALKNRVDEVKYNLTCRVYIYYLLDHLSKSSYSQKQKELLLQITAYRYMLYAEYNQNIDTLLTNIIHLFDIKDVDTLIMEDSLLKLNHSKEIMDDEFLLEYTGMIFAFKKQILTKYEKSFLDSIGVREYVKGFRKDIKKSKMIK